MSHVAMLRSSKILLAAVLLGAGCARVEVEGRSKSEGEAAPAAAPVAVSPVERGEYLVKTSGCHDCHTPLMMTAEGPKRDMSRMLSGHPASLVMPPPPKLPADSPWNIACAATLTSFAGPWGITYAPNLTPHATTGLGADIWTEEIFLKAIRTGKHFGTSRPIMPPMPWEGYALLTDDDLKAIYAYLKTIPPIDNQVPDWAPPAGPPAHN
jgi:hypothetical protein